MTRRASRSRGPVDRARPRFAVRRARDWRHGCSSVRPWVASRPPRPEQGRQCAPRPDSHAAVLGYNVGDYFQHWINLGKHADESKLPKVFFVN